MRILLHDNQLCERGTTNSVVNYARALRDLDHHVAISFRRDNPNNVQAVVDRTGQEFDLLPYRTPAELRRLSGRFDGSYFQKSGNRDGLQATSPSVVVHAVFQEFQPHGTSYIYISDWLARRVRDRLLAPKTPRDLAWAGRALGYGVWGQATGTLNAFNFESVPYICNMPAPSADMRPRLGIPDDAFVILRYGGMSTFDVEWVPSVLNRLLVTNRDLYFIGVNTPQAVDHARALFLPPVYSDLEKANLLACSDLFLTARKSGESFGLAHVEAMQAGKPILAYGDGWDRNHVEMLSALDGLYMGAKELERRVTAAINQREEFDPAAWVTAGNEYRPQRVVKQLLDAFGWER